MNSGQKKRFVYFGVSSIYERFICPSFHATLSQLLCFCWHHVFYNFSLSSLSQKVRKKGLLPHVCPRLGLWKMCQLKRTIKRLRFGHCQSSDRHLPARSSGYHPTTNKKHDQSRQTSFANILTIQGWSMTLYECNS